MRSERWSEKPEDEGPTPSRPTIMLFRLAARRRLHTPETPVQIREDRAGPDRARSHSAQHIAHYQTLTADEGGYGESAVSR